MSARGDTRAGDSLTAPEASARDVPATRRARWLDILAACVSLIGLADALYLTVEHISGRSVICIAATGCDKVLQSDYATLPGDLPLAALGALAYFTVFSLATLSAFNYRIAGTLLAPIVALMLASTLWLLYLQALVLQAFCTYCLLSACVTFALTMIVIARRFSTRTEYLS